MNSPGSNDTHAIEQSTRAAALELGQRARAAARLMLSAPDSAKSAALRAMAERLQQGKQALQEANAKDIEAARRNNLPAALVDRLTLSDKALATMTAGLQQTAAMPDPVGIQTNSVLRPNGMRVAQLRVPLRLIGITHEPRHNATNE